MKDTPPSSKKVFRTKLREYRLKKNITQDELAKLADTTIMTISYIENGKFFPNVTLAIELAEALDADVNDLFYKEYLNTEQEDEPINNGRVKRKRT